MATKCFVCRACHPQVGERRDTLGWPTVEVNGCTVHAACKEDAERAVQSYVSNTLVHEGGVIRWASNGRCPFDDMLTMWVSLGFITTGEAEETAVAREREATEFLTRLRENPPPITEGEIAEARAAHGPGVAMVNVLTNQRYTT